MTDSESSHIDLFRVLKTSLRRDLTVTNGIPNPVAGQILNWFDPANPEYLARVDSWQKALCRDAWAQDVPPFVQSLTGQSWYTSCPISPLHVKCIHQVAKLVYKWHGRPAKKTDWAEVEERLSHARSIRLTDDEIEGIRRCLSSICPTDLNQAIGRFGPGATAEGFNAYQKWMRIGYIPDVPPNLYRSSLRDTWQPAPVSSFRCTKAAEVPKSIKCNRIVSSEPAMSMFAQLAVNDDIVRQIHWLYVNHVSLHDQEKHNRLLYCDRMATLDLSDASDHNSCELVARVLPQLWTVLSTVRSQYLDIPGRGPIRLETFAPMGSGVCFSIMTTVILGIIRYAFQSLGYNWRRERWSVYGDDIIVPIWISQYVADLLERAGFVINTAKSCFSGNYVESCGLELYHKYDITPAYIRDPLDTLGGSKLESIADKIGELFPSTLDQILSIAQPIKGVRFNRNLQTLELLIRTKVARSKVNRLDGYAGLNRWFCVHTLQEYDRKDSFESSKPSGVECEVWTKTAWRYRSAINYPHLSLWFASKS